MQIPIIEVLLHNPSTDIKNMIIFAYKVIHLFCNTLNFVAT